MIVHSLRHLAEEYERGWDTMDVWFDSGSSWRAVLHQRAAQDKGQENLPLKEFRPADMYLEGHDQNRGWFQSSSLNCVSVTGGLPFKQFVTRELGNFFFIVWE